MTSGKLQRTLRADRMYRLDAPDIPAKAGGRGKSGTRDARELSDVFATSLQASLARQSRLSLPEAATSMPQTRAVEIQISGVTFFYGSNTSAALEDVSVRIEGGELVHIVGDSGSGKSTFAKVIAGVYTPCAGAVHIGGIDPCALDHTQPLQSVHMIAHDTPLAYGTLVSSLAGSFSATGAEMHDVIEACKLVGADEFITRLPMGYRTWLGPGGFSPSAGQRQLLVLASVLLKRPSVLILDEALCLADDKMRANLARNMPAICADRTVLVISQRHDFLDMRRRTLLMRAGRLSQ